MGSLSWLFLLFFLYHSQPIASSPLPSPTSPLCHPSESDALLQFSNSFSINQSIFYFAYQMPVIIYPKTVSWKNGTNCCSWDGVLCDRFSGHVIGLNLSYSCLQGPLHSNSSLFLLRHLQILNLDYNDFNGSPIPPEFGRFPNLTCLTLSFSNFDGYVPIELSYLSKLVNLYLTNEVYYSQYELRLDPYVFKRIVQNMTNLMMLSLYGVNMSNFELITSLMNISSSLEGLDLRECQLQGKFPENIFHLPNLQWLTLEDNSHVIGSLPTYNWSSPLRYLSLSNTKISIDLPYLSTRAKSLQSLYLKQCNFKGSYPALTPNLTQLVQLTSLDLSNNNFGGEIPWSCLNPQQLTFLKLSQNNFSGQLPEISSTNLSEISVLFKLSYLDLSSNFLSGSIPSWIFSLPDLRYLSLEINQLTGHIKEFQSRSLQQLLLHTNKLHGQIPSSIFEQENLDNLSLSYNNLSGVLELSKFSKLKNLLYLDLRFNSFSLSLKSYVDNPFPQLRHLLLCSCNITAFPYFIRSFERLEALYLSHNQIRGSIPEWLWNKGTHSLFYLNLSHNFLTSVEQIPWKRLRYLDLRSNHLQGNLPIVPPSLEIFFISNNQLSGTVPFLYCNLSALDILDLSNNSFHGNIPSCLRNLYFLSVFDLRMNKLTGTIPDMCSNSTHLRSLHLSGNQLEGPLPRSLRNCQTLEVLDAANNKIIDTFPDWLEALPMLQVLVLRSNRFHGSIGNPKNKVPFQKLRIMDLSHNELIGLLPTKYFSSFFAMMEGHPDSKLTHIGDPYYQDSILVSMKDSDVTLEKIISIFTTIDLSRNNFEGEVPESIGKLKSLKGLNFSGNKLTGCLPTSLRDLTNLEWLDLSSNELVGEIPSQLTDLTMLQVLNLSHNQLVGPIPSGKQFNTFNNDSYSGNLGLCGFPISKSCSKGEAQQEEDHDEEHTDGIFDWKIIIMGYKCGIVIGISIGYMVLFNKKFDYWLEKKVGGRWGRKRNARLRGRRRSN